MGSGEGDAGGCPPEVAMDHRPATTLVVASLAATLIAIAVGVVLARQDAGRRGAVDRAGSTAAGGDPTPRAAETPDPALPTPAEAPASMDEPSPQGAGPDPGALGPGPAQTLDPLALAPPGSVALELRLGALRRAPALAPLRRALEAALAGQATVGGRGLQACLPRLAAGLDRALLAQPVGPLGSGGFSPPSRRPRTGVRRAAGAGKESLVVLQGRFDARAAVRCLGRRPGARPTQGVLRGRDAAGRLRTRRWRGFRFGAAAGAGARVVIALDPGTLVLASEALLRGVGGDARQAVGVRGLVRRSVRYAGAGPRPGRLGRLGPMRPDAHSALRLLAPRLALDAMTIPVVPELRELRGAGLHLGLPGGGLDLRVVLELPSRATAATVKTKLEQALTLAGLAVPKALGLTAALQAAKVAARGRRVVVRLQLGAAALGRLVATLGRRLPLP